MTDAWNRGSTISKTIRNNMDIFVKSMEPEEIITKLFSKQILTDSDWETLEQYKSNNEKNRYILFHVVLKAPQKGQKDFATALLESGQQELYELLTRSETCDATLQETKTNLTTTCELQDDLSDICNQNSIANAIDDTLPSINDCCSRETTPKVLFQLSSTRSSVISHTDDETGDSNTWRKSVTTIHTLSHGRTRRKPLYRPNSWSATTQDGCFNNYAAEHIATQNTDEDEDTYL